MDKKIEEYIQCIRDAINNTRKFNGVYALNILKSPFSNYSFSIGETNIVLRELRGQGYITIPENIISNTKCVLICPNPTEEIKDIASFINWPTGFHLLELAHSVKLSRVIVKTMKYIEKYGK